jgi:succinoglycan biosynthesis protein ExoA
MHNVQVTSTAAAPGAMDGVSVSVVVPCLNGARFIERLLDAIRTQDESPLEVIIVDGGSTDGTPALLDLYHERYSDFPLITQTARPGIIPASLNAGIRLARGNVIVRLDVRSCPRPDYVRRAVTTLLTTGAGVVGGRWEIEPGAQTAVGRGIAWAVQHPLGAGDAAYRVWRRDGAPFPVDTVPFGCFKAELWDMLGGYNEALFANEDYEFNWRVRAAGKTVLLDPSIVSKYASRGDFSQLVRQYFRYGWWKAQMLKQHPASIRARQILPAMFVAGMIVLAIGAVANTSVASLFYAATLAYLIVVGAVSIGIAGRRRAWSALVVLPMVFCTIHFGWGMGVLVNGFTCGRWPRWK